MSSFMRNLSIISRCSAQYREEALQPYGIRAPQYIYFIGVCKDPGVSQDQLAERFCINKSNVARQLSSLEENGYFVRKRHPKDKRIMQIFPTQKAMDVLPEIDRVVKSWNAYVTSDLTEAEMTFLLATMEKITQKAREYVKKIPKE